MMHICIGVDRTLAFYVTAVRFELCKLLNYSSHPSLST